MVRKVKRVARPVRSQPSSPSRRARVTTRLSGSPAIQSAGVAPRERHDDGARPCGDGGPLPGRNQNLERIRTEPSVDSGRRAFEANSLARRSAPSRVPLADVLPGRPPSPMASKARHTGSASDDTPPCPCASGRLLPTRLPLPGGGPCQYLVDYLGFRVGVVLHVLPVPSRKVPFGRQVQIAVGRVGPQPVPERDHPHYLSRAS